MQNNCVKFGKVSLLQGFIFFPSLARGDSFDSPSLAEGARGWVNPLNDNTLDCHESLCDSRNDKKDSPSAREGELDSTIQTQIRKI